MTIRPPSPRYVGPPRHHGAANNKPIDRIVIHSTVSPCEPGGAEAIANYFKTTERLASAHYTVDPSEAIQAAWDSIVCYAAPPNQHSLHIEMCDIPGPRPTTLSARRRLRLSWRWARPNQQRMLRRTARLTARAALAYGVPIKFLKPAQLRSGQRGITTHNHVSLAWHQTDHWDPGWWPRFQFMGLVRAHALRLRVKDATSRKDT